jgi:hypothetical protein
MKKLIFLVLLIILFSSCGAQKQDSVKEADWYPYGWDWLLVQ